MQRPTILTNTQMNCKNLLHMPFPVIFIYNWQLPKTINFKKPAIKNLQTLPPELSNIFEVLESCLYLSQFCNLGLEIFYVSRSWWSRNGYWPIRWRRQNFRFDKIPLDNDEDLLFVFGHDVYRLSLSLHEEDRI